MIAIIACVDADNGIGRDGGIPWHLSPDLKRFRRLTQGAAIIMGRRTWESIGGKPLPNRTAIVVSSSLTSSEGCIVVSSMTEAIDAATRINDSVFVIGGSRIYEEALSFADTIYLTKIVGTYKCDVFFPEIDESEYAIETSDVMTEGDMEYIYITYQRNYGLS